MICYYHFKTLAGNFYVRKKFNCLLQSYLTTGNKTCRHSGIEYMLKPKNVLCHFQLHVHKKTLCYSVYIVYLHKRHSAKLYEALSNDCFYQWLLCKFSVNFDYMRYVTRLSKSRIIFCGRSFAKNGNPSTYFLFLLTILSSQ